MDKLKDVERSGYDLIWGNILASAYKDSGKPGNASVRTSNLKFETGAS